MNHIDSLTLSSQPKLVLIYRPRRMEDWVDLGTTMVSKQSAHVRYVPDIGVVSCSTRCASLGNWSAAAMSFEPRSLGLRASTLTTEKLSSVCKDNKWSKWFDEGCTEWPRAHGTRRTLHAPPITPHSEAEPGSFGAFVTDRQTDRQTPQTLVTTVSIACIRWK